MGEVQLNSLRFWAEKVVNDPEMLAEDASGNKVGTTEFREPIAKTFCNTALQRICRGMEYGSLDGMLADQIYDYCAKNWIMPYGSAQDRMNAARTASLIGDLAVLAVKSDPAKGERHGHVAVAFPDRTMVFSGKWGVYCPKVANVGKTNGVMGANYAFTGKAPPDVFILGKTVA